MEKQLREHAAHIRAMVDSNLDRMTEPMCEHEAAFVSSLYARIDALNAHVDKWAPRKPELDRILSEADPVITEYLDDLYVLFGTKGEQ